MKQLSPLDSVFIYAESNRLPMHVSVLAIYDQNTTPDKFVRFKNILATFEERLPLAPMLRRKLVRVPFDLDQPYWVEDPDFDLEYHIRHIALPRPGDRRQLNILVSRLHGHPMRLTRPLWDVYVIEGLDNVEGLPKGCFGMLIRMHHAAIDGASGHEVLKAIHDLSPDAKRPIPPDRWESEKDPGLIRMAANMSLGMVTKPKQVAETVARTVPAVLRGRKFKKQWRDEEHDDFVKTRFNHEVTPHRVLITRVFDLNKVRQMKNCVEGATVNDVVVTLTAGAMRRYLEAKQELPREDLVTMMPINIRDENEKTMEGNMVTVTTLDMHTTIADPVRRLKAVHESAVYTKAYQNAIGARTMTNAARTMPAVLMSLGVRVATSTGLARIPANTLVTNVPGSPVPMYMGGAKVVEFYGIAPLLDGMGLCHAVNSYCDTISYAVTSDRKMMPDPEFYEQCLVDTYEEMVEKCCKPKPAGRRKTASVRKED